MREHIVNAGTEPRKGITRADILREKAARERLGAEHERIAARYKPSAREIFAQRTPVHELGESRG